MRNLSQVQMDQFKRVFSQFDNNGDGVITTMEFRQVFTQMGYNYDPDAFKQILDRIDTNGDGEVSFNEFIKMMTDNTDEPQSQIDILNVFKIMDTDCNGRVGKQQLRNVIQAFSLPIDDNDIDLIFEEIQEPDLGISYDQFLRIIRCL